MLSRAVPFLSARCADPPEAFPLAGSRRDEVHARDLRGSRSLAIQRALGPFDFAAFNRPKVRREFSTP